MQMLKKHSADTIVCTIYFKFFEKSENAHGED